LGAFECLLQALLEGQLARHALATALQQLEMLKLP
jgi:hypothetical protein